MTQNWIIIINNPPLLPYKNSDHFTSLWKQACHRYRTLIRETIKKYRTHSIQVQDHLLQWTEYDQFVLGVADFKELKVEGVAILQEATCNENRDWCLAMNEILTNAVSRACAIYMHSMRYHAAPIDPEYCTLILCEEVRILIGHPDIYSLPPYLTWGNNLFDPLQKLFHANFSKIYNSADMLCWVLHHTEKQNYLLAFLMGLHPELGRHSILLYLWDDIARDLCCNFLHICDEI